jgi:hypothetical protein
MISAETVKLGYFHEVCWYQKDSVTPFNLLCNCYEGKNLRKLQICKQEKQNITTIQGIKSCS